MRPSLPAETPLDVAALRGMPLPDNHRDDKRGRGTVLVIAGSAETPGAALLAGTAALRMGAGRLQIASAQPVVGTLAVAVPEALVTAYEDSRAPSLRHRIATADAVVIGPGLADLEQATDLLAVVLDAADGDAIVVVDAMGLDALLALSGRSAGGASVIVTPNREELTRLGGDDPDDLSAARQVARQLGATVISFGRITAPDGHCWVDHGEVIGLGTSGAGDILAGAVGGVAARSHDVLAAAGWAALTHRLAANRAAASIAPIGYLARDVLDQLPRALAELDRLVEWPS